MILSFHLTRPRRAFAALRRRPQPQSAALWSQPALTVPLAAGLTPPPLPTGVALIAAWPDDAALDRFLAKDPLAARFADGWHTRLEPLQAFGAWPALPMLNEVDRSVDDDEPVAVLTLGRLRLRRSRAFFPASAAAEHAALRSPGLLAATALARPPRLLATFSLWQSAAAMRDYAQSGGGAHLRASRAHHAEPFHHESVFVRFRPYGASGSWRGFGELEAPAGIPAAAN